MPLCAKHAESDYNLYIHLMRINFYKAVNYNHAKKCHKKICHKELVNMHANENFCANFWENKSMFEAVNDDKQNP